jgi:hypothetical protein
MKNLMKISLIILFIFASCQKITEQKYILKFYGDAYEDIGYSVTIVSDGYVIAGQVEELTRENSFITGRNKNMAIIKTDWNGNVVWKVSKGGKFNDLGSKIYQNSDGSLICVGSYTDSLSVTLSETDVYIVKVSATGSVEWTKKYGGTGNQAGRDVVKIPDGYMILGSTDIASLSGAGSTGNIKGKSDIFLLKINESGDSIESFAYGYPGNDIGTVIKPDQAGNFVVFGTTEQSDPGQNKNNLLFVRINPVGYSTQPIIIGGIEDEYAADIEVLTDGYLLSYTVGTIGENQDIYVKKLKNDIYAAPYFTNKLSIINPGSTDNSARVYALSKYKTDSYILAGQSGKGSSADMLIFEINSDGNQVEGHQRIEGSTGLQVAYDVVSGDDEYIIAVGKNSYDINSMITFLKFKF